LSRGKVVVTEISNTVGQVKHGILQTGKTRAVIDTAIGDTNTLTGIGTVTNYFITSAQKLVLGLFVRSLSGRVQVKVYTHDNASPSERTLILDMGFIDRPTSEILIQETGLCLSAISIEVFHSADVNMRLMVKPIDSDNAIETIDTISAEETRAYRASVATCLGDLSETLSKILQHQRFITQIEDDIEGEY
jgi:hypothetical protein